MISKITINGGPPIDVKDLKIGIDMASFEGEKTVATMRDNPAGFIREVFDFKVSPVQEKLLKMIADNPKQLTVIPHRPIWPGGIMWRIQMIRRRQRNKRGRWMIREMRRRYAIRRVDMYGKLAAKIREGEITITVDEATGGE